MSFFTKTTGIIQSEIIIRTALKYALADIRKNPWLLDFAFASMPKDTVTAKEYGEKSLKEAKEWFLKNDIHVAINPNLDEGQFPLIAISPMDSGQEAETVGDVDSTPWEESDESWPVLAQNLKANLYIPETGVVGLNTETDVGIFAGMSVIDKNGKIFEITDVYSSTRFQIPPFSLADLSSFTLKGHRPNYKIFIESVVVKENYKITCYAPSEPIYISWLHSVVLFALYRYKQILLEARGFERATFSSSPVMRWQLQEAENVFLRTISVTGYVRHYWPKSVAPVIDGVDFSINDEMDGFKVSTIGGNVSVKKAVSSLDDVLWIGNEDSLSRNKK